MPKSYYSPAPSLDVEEAAPPTVYSDDPNTNVSTNGIAQEDHSKPRVPFRDETEGSVFDWGGSSSDISQTPSGVLHNSKAQPPDIPMENEELSLDEQMNIQESSSPKRKDDASFAPLSLDDDDVDLQQLSRAQASQSRHPNISGIFGNYGSSNKCYLLRTCICNSRYAILCLAWIGMMIGFGFVGYQAGQPADNASSTKGQEWIDWIENSKDHIHWPHFYHSAQNNNNAFAPQTQAQLLETSNLIFHSCNENSLSTSSGRNACISACHGRICCFEKEQSYGSCVNAPYSYCYAYAACENALTDFEMTNTNILASSGGRLNEQDKALLGSACCNENIQSLEGIRDCNAFCMHHLCCFTGEGCGSYPMGICDDYDACQVLVKDVVKTVATSGDVTNHFSGSMMRPTPSSTANGHDFAYHDPDKIRSSIASACNFDPLANDDSWVSGCHDLCADHLCCFGTPGTTSSCGNEKGLMCNDFAGCSVLVHQSKDLNHEEIKNKYVAHGPEMWPGSSVVPDDIREVNAACNDNVLGDSALKSRCEAACSSRNCCFTNGLGNCYLLVRLCAEMFISCAYSISSSFSKPY